MKNTYKRKMKYFMINNQKYLIDDVLTGKVKTEYPLNYLIAIAKEREWDGYLHVTDLLNGARETYLKYTTEYTINPDDFAYIVMGWNTHSSMNDGAGIYKVEIKGFKIKGEPDYIEEDTIWDFKNAGSFKIAKTLGIKYKDVIVKDQFGNPEVYVSGKKAGQIKTRKEPYLDPNGGDLGNYKLQLNMYRYLIYKSTGTLYKKLKIFFIVRDGNTVSARTNGINKNTYIVDIPVMDIDEIESLIIERANKVQHEIESFYENGTTFYIPRCEPEFTWEGRKCEKYCSVKEQCRLMDEQFQGGKDVG